jgi:hypothetical protein
MMAVTTREVFFDVRSPYDERGQAVLETARKGVNHQHRDDQNKTPW